MQILQVVVHKPTPTTQKMLCLALVTSLDTPFVLLEGAVSCKQIFSRTAEAEYIALYQVLITVIPLMNYVE